MKHKVDLNAKYWHMYLLLTPQVEILGTLNTNIVAFQSDACQETTHYSASEQKYVFEYSVEGYFH